MRVENAVRRQRMNRIAEIRQINPMPERRNSSGNLRTELTRDNRSEEKKAVIQRKNSEETALVKCLHSRVCIARPVENSGNQITGQDEEQINTERTSVGELIDR